MTEDEIKVLIRKRMAGLNLSMVELSRRTGISRNTLTNYFNRGRSMPLRVLIGIMQELGGKVEVGPWKT